MAAKPITGKAVLDNDHRQTYEDSVCDAQFIIAGEAVTAEDGATNDGLQQIVGKAHTAEDAQVMQHAAHTLESIPGRDNRRHNHQKDDEIVNGLEPAFQFAKVDESQYDDHSGRHHKNLMPNLQILPLIIEQPLTPQLHAKNKEAKQLCESAAEYIETEIYLKSITQVGEGILPECTMLMRIVDNP